MQIGLNFRDPSLPAEQVRGALNMIPHPEGGHYRELWRDQPSGGGRGAVSSIYFLLAASERSHWHRIDATEIWLWQAGAPLRLGVAQENGTGQDFRLGPDATNGETFQAVVPPRCWQAAESLGAWTLVSCIVAPAFQFEHFELAPPLWTPPAPEACKEAKRYPPRPC